MLLEIKEQTTLIQREQVSVLDFSNSNSGLEYVKTSSFC